MREIIPDRPFWADDEDIRSKWDDLIEQEKGFLHYCPICGYITYHSFQYDIKKIRASLFCHWCGYVIDEIMKPKEFSTFVQEVLESKQYIKYRGHLYLLESDDM